MQKAMETQEKKKTEFKRWAIYPGTFDPITYGHVDVISRALAFFEKIVVLVAHSGKKKPLFDATERQALVRECFGKDSDRVEVDIHDGLLADYARRAKINVVLRGLRGISDFDYEFQMATMNRRMFPELETFFLMASEKFFFVNSTLVKEVISHRGDVSDLVPPHVERKLRDQLC
jgi:pantetheine-phosphate adenylyltransferase